MALAAATVWEVRTTGNDNNGGGFVAGASGTDYSLQDSPQLAITDLACAGSTAVVTSATGGLTAQMIGNLIQIVSGTNFVAGFYEIVGHTDTNTITLDRDPTSGGAGSSGVANIGGCLATPHKAVDNVVAGNDVYVLTGSFTGTATILLDVSGTINDKTRLIGYKTGERATALTTGKPTGTDRPLYTVTSGTNTAFSSQGNSISVHNFRVNGAAKGGHGFHFTGYVEYVNCEAEDCNAGFFGEASPGKFLDCYAKLNVYGFYHGDNNQASINCVAEDNDEYGFYFPLATLIRCIARNNGGGSEGNGFHAWGGSFVMQNCIAYKNSKHGLHISTDSCFAFTVLNSIFSENGVSTTGYGISVNNNRAGTTYLVDHNAFYDGATQDAARNNIAAGPNDVTLSGDPFVDGDNGDFSLNNTTGAGADCKGAGNIANLDIGYAQSAAGGGVKSIFGGDIVR